MIKLNVVGLFKSVIWGQWVILPICFSYVVVFVFHVVFLKYLTKMVYKYEKKNPFLVTFFRANGTYFGCHSDRKETKIFSPNIYLINAVRSSFFVCSLFFVCLLLLSNVLKYRSSYFFFKTGKNKVGKTWTNNNIKNGMHGFDCSWKRLKVMLTLLSIRKTSAWLFVVAAYRHWAMAWFLWQNVKFWLVFFYFLIILKK